LYLGTRLQSKAGSGQRSQGGQGGTGAGLTQFIWVEQGLGPLFAFGLVVVSALAFARELEPFLEPVLEPALAPGGLEGGMTCVFNMYMSSDPLGILAWVTPPLLV